MKKRKKTSQLIFALNRKFHSEMVEAMKKKKKAALVEARASLQGKTGAYRTYETFHLCQKKNSISLDPQFFNLRSHLKKKTTNFCN